MYVNIPIARMRNGQIWFPLGPVWKEEVLKKMKEKIRFFFFKGAIGKVYRGQCLHIFQSES